jgi:fatty acid desaturase
MTARVDDPAGISKADREKIQYVRDEVTRAGEQLRARHAWLRHQDAIGALVLAISMAGMLACAWLFANGSLPAWACIALVALFASLTHELEHDLIHYMYFRRKPWAHHLMLALVWLARPSTMNPWARRELHFNHHRHSGTDVDIEERAITNGERWGLARLVMTMDNIASVLIRAARATSSAQRRRILRRGFLAFFPLGWLHWGLWYVFLGAHVVLFVARQLGDAGIPAPGWLSRVDFLVVVWIAPNVLRTFCLHFISSNMHYYGDIEDDNPLQQCQVLNAWWLLPLQAFCCNFGSTHAIHHFVVKEPFYIRQWTAAAGHRALRAVGVRFNDLRTFARANRYHDTALPATLSAA